MIRFQSSPFAGPFEQFVESLETSCVICSPYISNGPVDRMLEGIERRGLADTLQVMVVTDLSLVSLVQGSTDIVALIHLAERIKHTSLRYLPRIHAKAYVADGRLALITSANFTDGGAFANLEYGVVVDDAHLVRAVRRDIESYASLGGTVSLQSLRDLGAHVSDLRSAIREEQTSITAKLRAATKALQREAEDQLLRSRVAGRSISVIFGETILYLLSSGPLATVELHERIKNIHPDLCDDTLDRVIDGQHFGKLWKHQVRTAQQHLKQAKLIRYDAGRHVWAMDTGR
jgi:PLD-like domain